MARIEHLQAQVRLLLARYFAPSSEKLPDGQLGLFNEAEASAAQEPESAPATEVAAHRRATLKRAPLPDALARIDIEHPLAHDERTCPHHGVELERFGEVVSEQLDIIPAQVRVLRHVRGKYRCPHREGHLRTAAMPAQALPRSLASPGLLAHVATAKYADALPLYRQHQQLKRLGATSRAPRWRRGWCAPAHSWSLLINLLRDELLDRPYLPMDETTVQVLKEPGKGAQSKSQLWAQMSAGPPFPARGGRLRTAHRRVRLRPHPRRRQSQRTRTLRLPAPRVHRTAQGAITRRGRSPAAHPARLRYPHSSLAPRLPHQSASIAPFPGRLRFEGSTVTLIRPSRDLHALGRCPHVVAIRIGTSERTGQPGFTGFETIRRWGHSREAI